MESTRIIYEDHFGIVIQIYVTSSHFDSDIILTPNILPLW